MEVRVTRLEDQVRELREGMAALERRLARVEAREAVHPPRPEVVPRTIEATITPGALRAEEESTAIAVLSLVGRTCLVLGGAYLLRAVTDGGLLPRPAGVALGLAYALTWLLVAGRRGSSSGPWNGAFHAAAGVMTGFPLVWEATVRFHLFGEWGGAAAMAAVASIGFVMAWMGRNQAVAWVVTTASVLGPLFFMLALGPDVPFGFLLGFTGIVTLWFGYALDWIWLRWPVAFVLDLSVLVMAGAVTSAWQREGAGGVMVLQLVIFGAYLASVAARTLWRSRDVIPFEVVQTLALLVVGYGGAAFVMMSTGAGAAGLGLTSLAFGFGSYAVALVFAEREGHWKNLVFYTSLGLVFVLAGAALTMEAAWQAGLVAVLAVAAGALGRRHGGGTLPWHSALYLLAGGVSSQLFAQAASAFFASPAYTWPTASWSAAIVLVAASACVCIPLPANSPWAVTRLPRLAQVLTLLVGCGGLVIAAVVRLGAGQPGAGADAAVVAGIRTAVIATSALVLAWLGGRDVLPEGRWLTYAVLVVGGFKLVVEDFLSGRPLNLFLSLAFYGAALIVAPRLARRKQVREAPVVAAEA